MKAYYKERAPIYDKVYQYPERQEDLRYLEEYIPNELSELNVLEIAAGTGYWTQFIASKAKSVLATDLTIETLHELNRRLLPDNVSTEVTDAYSLDNLQNKFSGAFAGLWLSHVPKQKCKNFLIGLHQKLEPEATVILLDNSRVQCKRLPITEKDKFGNTYQDRVLDNGVNYKVLKNFPTKQELYEIISDIGFEQIYKELDNYWLFQYKVNGT